MRHKKFKKNKKICKRGTASIPAPELEHFIVINNTIVRIRGLRFGTYVNFEGPARVAIQGLTWVNFRFLAYPVNSGRPAWSMVRIREKLPMATAQVTCVSAGEL